MVKIQPFWKILRKFNETQVPAKLSFYWFSWGKHFLSDLNISSFLTKLYLLRLKLTSLLLEIGPKLTFSLPLLDFFTFLAFSQIYYEFIQGLVPLTDGPLHFLSSFF